jgi:TPR repeat protein
MYAAGDGIPRDYVRAHMWLSLAIAQGHDAAERSRGDIARSMTPEQIAEAEQLAHQWQPRAI